MILWLVVAAGARVAAKAPAGHGTVRHGTIQQTKRHHPHPAKLHLATTLNTPRSNATAPTQHTGENYGLGKPNLLIFNLDDAGLDRLYDADGTFAGVAAVDYKLAQIESLVAAAYNYSADGSIAFIVEPDGDLIAASLPNVALAYDSSGALKQVPAATCGAPLIRAAYAHGGHSALDLLTVDGAQYWILRSVLADAFGLRWNFTALHPTECPAGYGLAGLACAQCDPEDHMTSDAGSTRCDTCAEGYYKYAKDGVQRCAACSDAGDCGDLGLDPEGPTSLVHVGFFGGFADPDNASSSAGGGLLEAAAIAAMAADHFNARNATIVDWGVGDCDAQLQLTFHETRAVASEGIPAYYAANEFLDVVVGPAASAVAEPLATLAEIDDVPLMSYAAGSALLDEYAYFARANPSVEASADAVADWYAAHGWGHAAILYEKTNTYGLTAMEAFRTAAGFRAVSVASSGYDAGDFGSLGSALDAVLAATYDVVYAILDPADLGLLVAAAADRNVTGGDLHWVFGDSPSAEDVEAAAAAGYADVLRGATQVSKVGRDVPNQRSIRAQAVVHCVRDIDQSSVLYFALHARANDVEQFGDFLLRLINSTQKLRRSRRNLLKHRATIAIQRAWRRRKLGAAGAILAHLEATSGKHVIRRTFRARNSVTGGSADYSEGDDALARMRAGFATASSSARKLEAGGAALGRRLLGRGRSHSDEEDPRDGASPLARDPPPPPRRASGPGPVDEPPPERDQRSGIFGVVVGDSWVNDVVCYSNGADRDDHVVVCYSNEGEQDERAVAKARQQASRLPVEVP